MSIKPALTPEEWAFVAEAHVGDGLSDHIDAVMGVRDIDDGLHAAAAIALHDCRTPGIGFTREDVAALRYQGVGYDEGHDQEALDSIADRIEALLPPESA